MERDSGVSFFTFGDVGDDVSDALSPFLCMHGIGAAFLLAVINGMILAFVYFFAFISLLNLYIIYRFEIEDSHARYQFIFGNWLVTL